MAFELTISFTGLCLFVPDSSVPGKPKMQVLTLAPQADPAVCAQQEDHCTTLTYNAADARGGETGHRDPIHLKKVVIDLSDVSGGINLSLPPEVANLTELSGLKVRSDLVHGLQYPVSNRFTFAAGSAHTRLADGPWHFDPPVSAGHDLAWQVGWTMFLDDDQFVLWIDGENPLVLKPISAPPRKYIEIAVLNDAVSDPQVCVGSFAPHFEHFYKAVGTGNEVGPRPRWAGKDCHRGSPYTCMVAGGNPPP